MADFTRLGEAMCLSLGYEAGHFVSLYQANRANSTAAALEASPVGVAVRELVDNYTGSGAIVFYGTVKQLYDQLSQDHKQTSDGWPRSPKGLSEAIKRQSPALSALGISVDHGNGREYVNGQRGLTIKIKRELVERWDHGNKNNPPEIKIQSESAAFSANDRERF
jgi:hypothetical protein